MEHFANRVLVPRLKVNYQIQRTGKERMKMVIRHFKVNILPVQNEPVVAYELDYYIFEQETILSYQELKTYKIETFESNRE